MSRNAGAAAIRRRYDVAGLDVAAQVDDRLAAQVPEVVALVVGRREHHDLRAPPLAVRAGRVAEERAGNGLPGAVHPDFEVFLGDDARLDWEGLFPDVRADSAGAGDDVVRGGALTGRAGEPDADVVRQYFEVVGESSRETPAACVDSISPFARSRARAAS